MFCTECRIEADARALGWLAFRADTDGEEPELAFYCPRCAATEFEGYLTDRRLLRQMRREDDSS
jgi:hypothetical protein